MSLNLVLHSIVVSMQLHKSGCYSKYSHTVAAIYLLHPSYCYIFLFLPVCSGLYKFVYSCLSQTVVKSVSLNVVLRLAVCVTDHG